MTPGDPLDELCALLSQQSSRQITREGNALSLGFWSCTGRELPLLVTPTSGVDLFRLSDAGESWWELVSEGYADPAPSHEDRLRLERLCELYEVNWERHACEVFAFTSRATLFDVARRVVTASLAIDAWRAWYPPRQAEPVTAARRIVREVAALAHPRGWHVETEQQVQGRMRRWPASALLWPVKARQESSAVVAFVHEETTERVAQRMLGWLYDLERPLVFVVPEKAATELTGQLEFHERVAMVPRLQSGTPRLVIEGASRLFPRAA